MQYDLCIVEKINRFIDTASPHLIAAVAILIPSEMESVYWYYVNNNTNNKYAIHPNDKVLNIPVVLLLI